MPANAQVLGCRALGSLAVNIKNRVAIALAGGIAPVIVVMKEHHACDTERAGLQGARDPHCQYRESGGCCPRWWYNGRC